MPFRRRSRFRRRRRFIRRRYVRRSAKFRAFRRRRRTARRNLYPKSLWPKVMRKTLKYSQVALTIPLATRYVWGFYVFSGNSVYDPYVTGVGHQPLGFDQIMLGYEHVYVVASRITCKFTIESSTTNAIGIWCGPTTTFPFASTSGGVDNCLEQAQTTFKICPPGSGNPRVYTMKRHCYTNKMLPVKRDQLVGTAAVSPVEQYYWYPFHVPLDGDMDGGETLQVYLEYDCLFLEPKNIATS